MKRKDKTKKRYVIKRVVWEFYDIEACSRDDAIRKLAVTETGPFQVTTMSEQILTTEEAPR